MSRNEQRPTGDPFREVVRSGPFAWIYWSLTLAAIVAVVVGIFGDTSQRVITGVVVFVVIVVLATLRFILAARLRHRRS